MKKKSKQPWPTKAVMEQIYDLKLWGGKTFDFYSGEGSHNSKIIQPYLRDVITFFKSLNYNLVVCDLGCGDFNIGYQLYKYTKNYIGIDIVESLIERNKTRFEADNLEFHCFNIVNNPLPKADCVLLRQVLQHLSNAEIKNIIHKLSAYKYIIITEHLPIGDFTANKDVITGQGIRLKQKSGVNVLQSPFDLEPIKTINFTTVVLEGNKGCITTKLYQMF